jgi:hypothetical protein
MLYIHVRYTSGPFRLRIPIRSSIFEKPMQLLI